MNLNSTVRFTADGTVSTVNLTYDVLPGDEIQVFFGDQRLLTGWALESNVQPQRVQFDTNIPDGTQVLIRRYTDMRDVPHVFHFTGNGRGGAEFNASNMDENFDKIKRASQDAMDSFELIGVNIEAAFDAKVFAEAAEVSKNQAELSASQANTSRSQAQTAATTATNKAGEATNAASTAVTKAGEALNSQTAAEVAKLAAESYANTATTKAGEASNSATTASTAASTATTKANQASSAATTATNAKDTAVDAASDAADFANSAFSYSTMGYAHVLKAQEWAEKDVDLVVDDGGYSAKHWAIKAADIVQSDVSVSVSPSSSINFTGNGTLLDPLTANVVKVDWTLLDDVPTEFTPKSHTHDWADISDVPDLSWSGIVGKPTTFPPTAHNHAWGDVTDKPTSFPPETHAHPWGDITGKPSTYPSTWAEVGGKPSTFSPTAHSHTTAQISGLGSAAGYNVGSTAGNIPVVGQAGLAGMGSLLSVMNPLNNPSGFYKYDNSTASKVTSLGVRGAVFNIQQDWNSQSQAQIAIPYDDYRTMRYRAGNDKVWQSPVIYSAPTVVGWSTVTVVETATTERKTTTGQRVRPINGTLDISWEAHVNPWQFNTEPSTGAGEITVEVWVQPVGGVEVVSEPHVKAIFPDLIGGTLGSTTHFNAHFRNMAGRKVFYGLDPTKLYDVKIKIFRTGDITKYTLHYLYLTIVP